MAISFLQDDLSLSNEEWDVFYKNIEHSEFEVGELGTFGFCGEGTPEFDDCDMRYGMMSYVVENLDENEYYLFKVGFVYSDCYDLRPEESYDSTLIAISKSDSLNY